MGCAVNGPGEAGDADFGIAGGRDAGPSTRTAPCCGGAAGPLVDELFGEIDRWIAEGMPRPERGRRKLDLPVVVARKGRMNHEQKKAAIAAGAAVAGPGEALAPRAAGGRRRAAAPSTRASSAATRSGTTSRAVRMSAVDAAEERLAPLEAATPPTGRWPPTPPTSTQQAAEAQIAYEEALSDPALQPTPRCCRGRRPTRCAGPTRCTWRRPRTSGPPRCGPHRRARDRAAPVLRPPRRCRRPEVTDNEIAEILRRRPTSPSAARRGTPRSDRRRSRPRSCASSRMRNQAAQALGHRDHYAFSLAIDELDEDWLFALLDDLERACARALEQDEGRHRRRPAGASACPPARRCSPGTTPTRSSRTRRRPATTRCSRPSRTSTRSTPRALLRRRSATMSTPSSRAPTCTRARARTSTPSR